MSHSEASSPVKVAGQLRGLLIYREFPQFAFTRTIGTYAENRRVYHTYGRTTPSCIYENEGLYIHTHTRCKKRVALMSLRRNMPLKCIRSTTFVAARSRLSSVSCNNGIPPSNWTSAQKSRWIYIAAKAKGLASACSRAKVAAAHANNTAEYHKVFTTSPESYSEPRASLYFIICALFRDPKYHCEFPAFRFLIYPHRWYIPFYRWIFYRDKAATAEIKMFSFFLTNDPAELRNEQNVRRKNYVEDINMGIFSDSFSIYPYISYGILQSELQGEFYATVFLRKSSEK